MPAAYFQVHFRQGFIIETNTMDSDQAAPKREQSDLGPFFLQNRLPKNISR